MLKSVRCAGFRSLMRNVHWLQALTAATIIVSSGPRSSSDAKSTAYETDIVDPLRASGSVTLKTDVTDDSASSRRNSARRLEGLDREEIGEQARAHDDDRADEQPGGKRQGFHRQQPHTAVDCAAPARHRVGTGFMVRVMRYSSRAWRLRARHEGLG